MGYTLISLFTGAGGLDYGLERAGFETLGAFESDSWCVQTLRQNRRWPVFHDAISFTTNISEIIGVRLGDVDLMAGGPPCQPFSHAANWANGRPNGIGDDRACTVQYFMRLIEQVMPKTILFENVPGFESADQGVLEYVRKRLRQTNRKFGTKYGVPQHRRRFFLIASREGKKFEYPKPTHGCELSHLPLKYVTAWDAVRNLRLNSADEDLAVRGRWADLLPSIPEGQNYLWHTTRGEGVPLFGWRTKYWSFLLKLAKNRPSWTIPASPSQNAGPFHWENRLLSTQEMMRLQTFPDEILIRGDRAARQRQIGNAVPSLVGEVLGRAIVSQLLGKDVDQSTPPTLSISKARKIPKAARRQAVPGKYLRLKGAHKAHPGTGRGPRARRLKRKAS
jgi:DNA (cytosine-5)-methyltransferase 1